MNVAEELIEFEDQIDRPHVERRVEEWRRRIEDLYTDVATWLPSDWSTSVDEHVSLPEELMRKFGIAERRLPVLSLRHGDVVVGRLEPRGLWIIGANGRVDLIVPPRHVIIADQAENFETPRWITADLRDRRSASPFTRETLRAVLA